MQFLVVDEDGPKDVDALFDVGNHLLETLLLVFVYQPAFALDCDDAVVKYNYSDFKLLFLHRVKEEVVDYLWNRLGVDAVHKPRLEQSSVPELRSHPFLPRTLLI